MHERVSEIVENVNYRQILFPSVIFKILLFPRQCSIVPDFNLVNRPPVHETSTDAETAESEYIRIASNVLVGSPSVTRAASSQH